MKKKRRLRKFIILLFIIVLLIYGYNLYQDNFCSQYKAIKQDINKNYAGIGQERVKNKDGYFTTFTTVDENKKIYKEYKQNGTSSWSNKSYWGDTMSKNGCGITVMATILSGYGKDCTPEILRQNYYPVLDYSKLASEFQSTYGIKTSDFYYDVSHLSNSYIEEYLQSNRPIIVCVWNQPNNNRWTTASHYMALLATDGKGKVYVSNPNGGENDSKSSGWYDINEVTPYIAKALFIESY